jgi:hypothetical protein
VTEKFEFIDAEYAVCRESGDKHMPSVVKMCRCMEVSVPGKGVACAPMDTPPADIGADLLKRFLADRWQVAYIEKRRDHHPVTTFAIAEAARPRDRPG